MNEHDANDMEQLRVDDRVVAEWKDGTIHVFDHRDGVEVRQGWPGT